MKRLIVVVLLASVSALAQAPTISAVVPLYGTAAPNAAAGYVPILQPGSWATLWGNNLSTGTFVWDGSFPVSLGNVSVTIGGLPAYLWYVSPGQINFQVPGSPSNTALSVLSTNTLIPPPGAVPIIVSSSLGTAQSSVWLTEESPTLLLQPDGRHVLGIVVTPGQPGNSGLGYDVIGPSRPLKYGEVLTIYGTGFGWTNPPEPVGRPFSGAAKTTLPLGIWLGVNKGLLPDSGLLFSGLIGPGLYQFNVLIPPGDFGPGCTFGFSPCGDVNIGAWVSSTYTTTQQGILVTLQ